ncbi:unnamed protein product [Vitrella brassicaformis CCMP3155]|uniref:DNA-directed RNA polymerases I, II, and III subunit RPABC3 n=1 Tax=Vitrella brassicaformis (strain CCMP3155) TaxID=1169540 RepID=A0A0G4FVV7_VITBC|nr:unnamed protein product [Vitrella brassicaformis CCMP3155]|mmetsp:Transcript_50835/g.127554  ORF Transcript_50835/g.127554 Transcript_50835/m.127554 type:complete len:143 (-) Transcript_50835:595-1023(-)|eukprot:CEM19315.1 unnamed protein product [Vitrella brassicaformis CCMP3155]
MALSPHLLDDAFKVKSVDNSKFEKVSRVKCEGMSLELEMTIDINTDIFPINENEVVKIALNDKLAPPDVEGGQYFWDKGGDVMDMWDYIMYGKIFKYQEKGDEKVNLYASFGGLLMSLSGDRIHLENLQLDTRIYFLLRRDH